jgi:hypothetical protein
MPTSTPKKISVCHAEWLAARSFHDNTFVTSNTVMPTNAVAVALMSSASPSIQSPSSRTKVATMIHSLRETPPSSVSSAAACPGAFGVALRPGGKR